MAAQRYSIQKNDVSIALKYLKRQISLEWPSMDTWRDAEGDLNKIKSGQHKKLNAWSEAYLSTEQWTRLKASIRAGRKRNSISGTKSVDLSIEAWILLSDAAQKEGVTLSQAIIKHLKAK